MIKYLIHLWILASSTSYALSCPDYTLAPLCPLSGSTLLDETYPTQSFVISNKAKRMTINSAKVTVQFILAIAESYHYENIPQVLFPTFDYNIFTSIVEQVKKHLEEKKLDPIRVRSILEQITHISAQDWTWQQDYFESFVDLETGAPVLRQFESYKKVPDSMTDQLAEAAHLCKITNGPTLPSHRGQAISSYGFGEMGGNTEGAPGGLCLIGYNQSINLAKDYCGSEENVVQLHTSWLSVGHVDELFKIIPSHFNDKRPKSCQFSVMAASPKKALELMNKEINSHKLFFNFKNSHTQEEYLETLNSRTSTEDLFGNQILCELIQRNQLGAKKNKNDPLDLSLCAQHLEQIRAKDLGQSFIENHELMDLNLAIQDSIDLDKLKIKEKILKKLPECKKFYDEVDVPDLFYGLQVSYDLGKPILPQNVEMAGSVNSFFPNPTNSVLMNRTLLLSQSGSPLFDDYIKSELKKRKLETLTIDSWDYAHVGHGNIHCASHSIPYCRPRN